MADNVPSWAQPIPSWAQAPVPAKPAPVAAAVAPVWAQPAAAKPAGENAIAELGRRENDILSGSLIKDAGQQITKPFQQDNTAGAPWLQRIGDIGGRIGSVATDVLGSVASPVEAGVKTTLNRTLPDQIQGDKREKLVQDIGDVGTAALLAPTALGKEKAAIASPALKNEVISNPNININGLTKLYRGEGEGGIMLNSTIGGPWYTTNLEKAKKYGNTIKSIDAYPEDFKKYGYAEGAGGPDEFVIDHPDFLAKAKPYTPEENNSLMTRPQLDQKMVDIMHSMAKGEIPEAEGNAMIKDMADTYQDKLKASLQQPAAAPAAPQKPSLLSSLQNIVSPTSGGEGAQRMETNIRQETGLANRNTAMAEARLDKSSKLASQMTPEQHLDYYRVVEGVSKGEKLHDPALQQFADDTRKVMKDTRAELESMPDTEKMGFFEDYFPHNFENPEAVRAWAAGAGTGKQGSSGALRKRQGPPNIEEAVAAGFKLKDPNPVRAASKYVTSMNNYIASRKIVNEAKRVGDAGMFRPGKQPEGWVPLTGRFSKQPARQLIQPGAEGAMDTTFIPEKQLYAPADVARIHNNYYSTGLEGTQLAHPYEAMRAATAANTAAELALSAYHATTITMQSIINDVSRILKNTRLGDWEGVGKAAKSATAGQLPFVKGSNYKIGSKLIDQYKGLSDNGIDMEAVADHFAKGGGKIGQDKLYRGEALGGFLHAMKRGQGSEVAKGLLSTAKSGPLGIPKAALQVLDRATQDISYPLFEHYIPRVKTGAFANLMSDWMRQNPMATQKQIENARKKYVDLVDDRFGEMNMDNIFWPKLQKQLASLFLRAQGWDIGLVRQAGGGTLDTVRAMKNNIQKKGFDESLLDRPSFLAATIMVNGLAAAAYQYLATGKPPNEMLDYMAPKTGGVTASGAPERVQLPGHGKELVQMATPTAGEGPLSGITRELSNKVATLPKNIYEAYENQDYRGDPIGNTTGDSGWLGSMGPRIGHVAGGFMPFTLGDSNAAKVGSNLGPVERRLFGMRPAGMALTDQEGLDEIVNKVKAKQWKTKMKHDAKAEGNLQ